MWTEGRDRQCSRAFAGGSVPAGPWTECNPGASLPSGCPDNHASWLSLIELAYPAILFQWRALFNGGKRRGQSTAQDDSTFNVVSGNTGTFTVGTGGQCGQGQPSLP